ncbi:hypothetical protein LTR56_016398 [Elasticomyces elasticus]|nr:hypothetical protein LTR56_016398 [Elasticomyces elasticus]KAK3636275.1 hypothetical protein LTR22_018795 [Elasticomyces elasticus]
MKLPYLPHDLHLTRPQHHALESIVDSGKEAMHIVTRTLVGRTAVADSASSSSTCEAGNKSAVCAKPTDGGSSQTLPIVLGAVIPVCCAIIACFFLHRRYLKRQRLEDAKDSHKSLDFGVDMAPSKKGRKHADMPEMKITDMSGGPPRPGGRGRGLSMDMSNPYLMPAGLQDSRESIHSMSRSLRDEHDPYRPVALLRTSQDSGRPRNDNASQYSASTLHSANEKANLLSNAQRMSRSDPRVASPLSPHSSQSTDDLLPRQMHSNNRSGPPSRMTSMGSSDDLLPAVTDSAPPPRKQSLPKSLPRPPPPPAPPVEQERRPRTSSQPASRPPRKSSASAGAQGRKASPPQEQSYFPPVPPSVNEPEYDVDPAMITSGRYSIDTPNPSKQFPVPQQQQPSMGLRPLPPDMPAEENAEVRANRIRSFYKEYFDDSRPRPAPGQYVEDVDPAFADAAIYDPETGGFAMPAHQRPFAAPIGRRAMTPPPRGAPRAASRGPGPHSRRQSTQSAGGPQNRGRQGPGGPPPPMPKKRAPPPKPLLGLPTPHKLKDFDSVISTPIDFAPPNTFRTYQNGSAPSSPTGLRPYSPGVKAFTPLISSHDDLSVMPSPHLLRKSGTFDNLDFAPPSRLRTHDSGSDAGSIRSARSGISAMQMDAVRAGAYRVSRIPKEMVTSREDLNTMLKPRLNMITPA